jgi:hypothetical protein
MIKNERLFYELSQLKTDPTELGRRQFFLYQSSGLIPGNPDPYYETLTNGKWQFDFLSSEYLKMWRKREWWGWYLLWNDWEGRRWILPYLVKWYPGETGREIPAWITLEVSDEDIHKHIWGW